jgi:hypothetical protein
VERADGKHDVVEARVVDGGEVERLIDQLEQGVFV